MDVMWSCKIISVSIKLNLSNRCCAEQATLWTKGESASLEMT